MDGHYMFTFLIFPDPLMIEMEAIQPIATVPALRANQGHDLIEVPRLWPL